MKKAALYARVSSLDQREGRTIESQLDELRRHIVGDGHLLVKEYIDDGYTGTRLDRPALEQMRADLKTKLFDAIYFHVADRMARDSTHQDMVMNDIIRNGKLLYINNEEYENSPEHYFKLKILGLVAELERAKIVERTTRGRLHRLRMGHVTSQGSNRIYGYRYVKKTQTTPPALVIYEPEAKIVRKMFEMMASGTYSIHRITRWLEEHEVPTRMGRKLWESYTISKMLENLTYAGTRHCNRMAKVKETADRKKLKYGKNIIRDRKEWITVKVPAIVSEEL